MGSPSAALHTVQTHLSIYTDRKHRCKNGRDEGSELTRSSTCDLTVNSTQTEPAQLLTSQRSGNGISALSKLPASSISVHTS